MAQTAPINSFYRQNLRYTEIRDIYQNPRGIPEIKKAPI